MRKLLYLLLAALWSASVLSADVPGDQGVNEAVVAESGADSRQMERDLQRLPWLQFKSVVEAIPKLKASIEAYGPIGWQFVQENYANYGWKKKIDKLDGAQKKLLSALIQTAKEGQSVDGGR